MNTILSTANSAIQSLASRFQPSQQVGLDLIPDFHAQGITEKNEIREELRRGPTIAIEVGTDGIIYLVPVRLLLYHSPWFRSLMPLYVRHDKPIDFKLFNPKAFDKLLTWLHEGHMGNNETKGLMTQALCLSPHTMEVTIRGCCQLLCEIYYLADHLDLEDLQRTVLDEVASAADLLRNIDYPSPFLPQTVIQVYRLTTSGSPLRILVVEKLKSAAAAMPNDIDDWEACFSHCTGLREEVAAAVEETIRHKWKLLADDESWDHGDVALDEGRPAGWWTGPY